jgi:hypothetical protein
MPAALLDSQLALLEEPTGALTMDAARPLPELIEQVCRAFPALIR